MNLHLNCSEMLNLEMHYIYYNPEKINNHMCYGNVLFKFITFQFIKKLFIPCTHSALSKGRNTYNKIQFTNQSNLEHDMKEMGGERKTGRCAWTCSQTHRPSQLLHTHCLIHTIQPFRAHITGSFQMHGVCGCMELK